LNVNISNSDLSKARFNGVTATLVDLSESNFTDTEIKGTDLSKCCLNNAILITFIISRIAMDTDSQIKCDTPD